MPGTGQAAGPWFRQNEPRCGLSRYDLSPIVVFAQDRGSQRDATPWRVKHYYVDESVGIAVGILLSALHLAGLATLTYTPSPMEFLRTLLARPANERAYVVIPVGYPADGAMVPDHERKPLDLVFVRR